MKKNVPATYIKEVVHIETDRLFCLSPMASNIFQLASQYTEDSVATEASCCQRPSCSTIIQPGEPRLYVAPQGQSNQPGRYVCGPCMKHYLEKPSATARVQVPTATSGI